MNDKKNKMQVTAITNSFGHKIEFVDGVWKYADTQEIHQIGPSNRNCPKCSQKVALDGSDPCISNLPGVIAACCGHGCDGEIGRGYIAFSDGTRISFTGLKVERNGIDI